MFTNNIWFYSLWPPQIDNRCCVERDRWWTVRCVGNRTPFQPARCWRSDLQQADSTDQECIFLALKCLYHHCYVERDRWWSRWSIYTSVRRVKKRNKNPQTCALLAVRPTRRVADSSRLAFAFDSLPSISFSIASALSAYTFAWSYKWYGRSSRNHTQSRWVHRS